jgi:hypothetical protein
MKSLLAILLCVGFAFSAIPPYLADPGPYPGFIIHKSKVVKTSYTYYASNKEYTAIIIIQDTIHLCEKNWQYDCMAHYVGRCATPYFFGGGQQSTLCTLSILGGPSIFTGLPSGVYRKGKSQISRGMGIGATDSFGTIRTYPGYATMIVSTDTITWNWIPDSTAIIIGTKRFLSVPIGIAWAGLRCLYDSSAYQRFSPCGGVNYDSVSLFRIILMKAFAQDTVLIQVPNTSVEKPAPLSLVQIFTRKGTYDVLGRRIQSMNPASAIYLEGGRRIVIH